MYHAIDGRAQKKRPIYLEEEGKSLHDEWGRKEGEKGHVGRNIVT